MNPGTECSVNTKTGMHEKEQNIWTSTSTSAWLVLGKKGHPYVGKHMSGEAGKSQTVEYFLGRLNFILYIVRMHLSCTDVTESNHQFTESGSSLKDVSDGLNTN